MKSVFFLVFAFFPLLLRAESQNTTMFEDLLDIPHGITENKYRILEKPDTVNVIANVRSFSRDRMFNSNNYNLYKPEGLEMEMSESEKRRVSLFLNKVCGGGIVFLDTVKFLQRYEGYLAQSDAGAKYVGGPEDILFYGEYNIGGLQVQILGELNSYLVVTVLDFDESRIMSEDVERLKIYFPFFESERMSALFDSDYRTRTQHSVVSTRIISVGDELVPLSKEQNMKNTHAARISFMSLPDEEH